MILKVGMNLRPKHGDGQLCTILEEPTPPKKEWLIEYASGRQASKTKSFLKKYYEGTER